MLVEEARWFADAIRDLAAANPKRVFPICNVGSSSGRFRTVDQPWMEDLLFGPLRADGSQVVHVDLKAEEGVDVVGDFSDPAVQVELGRRRIKSVLCSNMLEHVRDPPGLARMLADLVETGGYLFISCPYRYPYHADPLDNGLRLRADQLAELFPGLRTRRQEIIRGGTAAAYVAGPAHAARAFLRLLVPFYRPRRWLTTVSHLLWLGRRFEISCVVLEKPAGLQT